MIHLGLYLCGIPSTFISQYAIEKWGRRPMLILSGICMASSSIIMGSIGVSGATSYQADQSIVAMVWIFLITYSLTWGPTVWVVCSEISAGRNRGRLMSISTGSNWLFNWLVSFTFPYLFNADSANLGPRVGFIYGVMMICACIWVYIFMPATAKRTLEEIDAMFENNIRARDFSCKLCSLTKQCAIYI